VNALRLIRHRSWQGLALLLVDQLVAASDDVIGRDQWVLDWRFWWVGPTQRRPAHSALAGRRHFWESVRARDQR
jgi:hypothetical protein